MQKQSTSAHRSHLVWQIKSDESTFTQQFVSVWTRHKMVAGTWSGKLFFQQWNEIRNCSLCPALAKETLKQGTNLPKKTPAERAHRHTNTPSLIHTLTDTHTHKWQTHHTFTHTTYTHSPSLIHTFRHTHKNNTPRHTHKNDTPRHTQTKMTHQDTHRQKWHTHPTWEYAAVCVRINVRRVGIQRGAVFPSAHEPAETFVVEIAIASAHLFVYKMA